MDSSQHMIRRYVALLVAVMVSVTGAIALVTPSHSYASERDDQVRKRNAAARQAQKARSSLEGVNKNLANVVVKLQQVEQNLGSAKTQLNAAQAKVESQKREQANLADRLTIAEDQLTTVTKQLDEQQIVEDETNQSIGEIVRDTYRNGGSTSPLLTFALSNESTEDITKASQAANTAARLQSDKLEKIQTEVADTRNKKARQSALKDQVEQLKREADEKLAQYQAAEAEKQRKLQAYQDLQGQQQSLKANLESRKGELQQDLAEAQATQNRAQAQINAIDAENRRLAAAARAKQEAAQREAQRKAGRPYTGGSTGPLIHPISGPLYVTSPFGYRIHPVTGYRRLHAGVDLASPTGQVQVATANGTVKMAGWYGTCGNAVIINHGWIGGNTYQTMHCHLSSIAVRYGQHVSVGQVIGRTGATGRVTGPHVHYQVWRNGGLINPMSLPGF